MRTILAILALATLVLGSAGVQAAACSTTSPNSGVTAIAGKYYLDDRGAGSVWLYEEANNVGGLQRGGCSAITGDCDACFDDPQVGHDRLLL